LFDDDFDGRFESRQSVRRGQPHIVETDADGDGFYEGISRYQNGVIAEWDVVSPLSRRVVKRSYFRAGQLFAADFDADGDGKFERRVEYDEKADPKP
jgi:hypothetical protein